MKLLIKDKNSEYYIQIESLDKKVIDVKIEMQKQFGLDLKKIKLIYSGKYLADNQTLKSYHIIENSKLFFLGVIDEANIISKKEKNSSNFEDSNENNEEYSSQLHNLIQLGYEKEKAKSIIKKFNGDIKKIKDENKMNIILNNIKKNNPALLNQIKNHEVDLIKFLSSPITQKEIDIYKKNCKNAKALLD